MTGATSSRVRFPTTVAPAAVAVLVTPLMAAIVAWRKGWMPMGDEAAVMAQSWGVLTTSPPLLGNYSSVTTATDTSQTLYHPGPLQLWLLAIPQHLFAPSNAGVLIGSALLVTTMFGLVLWACRRVAGTAVLITTVVMLACFMNGMGAHSLRSLHMGTMPVFVLLGFVGACWAVMNRADWFWPAGVACASLAVQAQVSFSVPIAVIVCAVVIVRVVTWSRDRRDGRTGSRRRTWMITGTATVVAAMCWAGPLYDQFFGSGNLLHLLAAGAEADAVGPAWGWNRFLDAFSFPPAWTVVGVRFDVVMLPDGRLTWQTPLTNVIAATLFWMVFVVLVVRCVRRRNRPLASLAILAVASTLGAFIASTLMPDDPLSLLGHAKPWWIASFLAWLFVVAAVAEWVVSVVRARVRTHAGRARSWVIAAACLTATVVPLAFVLSRSSPSHDESSSGFGAVDRFTNVAMQYCSESSGGLIVTQDGVGSTLTTLGVIAELQLRGCEVHVEGDLEATLSGPWFRPTGEERFTLRVASSSRVPAGYREVSVYDPADPPARYRGFDNVYVLLQRSAPMYLDVRGE